MTTDLRRELHAFLDKLVDAIESTQTSEWVDQRNSPLGRERHCRLVREGAIKGVKEGKRIMIRRADIETFLSRRAVIKVDEKEDEDRAVRRIIAEMGRKSA